MTPRTEAGRTLLGQVNKPWQTEGMKAVARSVIAQILAIEAEAVAQRNAELAAKVAVVLCAYCQQPIEHCPSDPVMHIGCALADDNDETEAAFLARVRSEAVAQRNAELAAKVRGLPARPLEVVTQRHWVSGLHVDLAAVLALIEAES